MVQHDDPALCPSPLYHLEKVTTLTILCCSSRYTANAEHVVWAVPIVGNGLDRRHLTVNDAVISLRNAVVLGLDRVGVGMGYRLLLVTEDVMAA
jgi:hypothetical protein